MTYHCDLRGRPPCTVVRGDFWQRHLVYFLFFSTLPSNHHAPPREAFSDNFSLFFLSFLLLFFIFIFYLTPEPQMAPHDHTTMHHHLISRSQTSDGNQLCRFGREERKEKWGKRGRKRKSKRV
ncbi:hypothetical protein AAZX31_07G155500 [Glycine max]